MTSDRILAAVALLCLIAFLSVLVIRVPRFAISTALYARHRNGVSQSAIQLRLIAVFSARS